MIAAPGMAPGMSSAPITPSPMPYPSVMAPGSAAVPPANPLIPPAFPSPSVAPGPGATLQGTIQPPPSWDPYASQAAGPATLFPNDPYLQSGGASGATPAATKLLQEIRLQHHWLSPSGSHEFGTNDTETSATFAFPLFFNRQTPLLVTPGFAIHLWDGPRTTPTELVDLPPRVYDAFLDAAWNPQITPWLGAELGARVGVYSDFEKVVSDSVRIQARGLAAVAISPSFQLKAGVIYLDRNKVKLLPAGGVVWIPNPDTRFDILFPNPKLAKRLTTTGTFEWWYYLRGEYGGGTWTVHRATGAREGLVDSIDYNDLRVALGSEFVRTTRLRGFCEVGLSFEREILFYPVENRAIAEPQSEFKPSNTVFLGGGLAY